MQAMVSHDMTQGSSIHALIDVVRDLTGLMSKEVELLRAMQVQEFGKLQSHKLELIRNYERESAVVREDPAFLDSLDERLRDELRDVVERMNAVMKQNEVAILAAKRSNEKLIGALSEAVRAEQDSAIGYSDQGARAAGPASAPPALRIDQQL